MVGFMFAGMMTVMTVFMMMARTDMLKWLGYANIVDVGFTLIMIYLFHDTFSGVVSAACAGVFMSGSLWIMKNAFGYKRVQFKTGRFGIPTAKWVYHPGKFAKGV